MPKGRMPQLGETGRRYVENTMRARLATPGILRYRSERPRTARNVALAALFAAALLASLLWLAGRM